MFTLDGRRVKRRGRPSRTDAQVASGLELPFRAFPTVGVGISQGEVVSNKLLGAALGQIRAQQLERDEQRLAKAITRRERRLIVNNRPTG